MITFEELTVSNILLHFSNRPDLAGLSPNEKAKLVATVGIRKMDFSVRFIDNNFHQRHSKKQHAIYEIPFLDRKSHGNCDK